MTGGGAAFHHAADAASVVQAPRGDGPLRRKGRLAAGPYRTRRPRRSVAHRARDGADHRGVGVGIFQSRAGGDCAGDACADPRGARDERQDVAAPGHVSKTWNALRARGVHFIGPEEGLLACGYEGVGRLWPVEGIVEAAERLLAGFDSRRQATACRSLDVDSRTSIGCRCESQTLTRAHTGAPAYKSVAVKILVTAGPTREPTRSRALPEQPLLGQDGYAIARAAVDAGHETVLVSGPVALSAAGRRAPRFRDHQRRDVRGGTFMGRVGGRVRVVRGRRGLPPRAH